MIAGIGFAVLTIAMIGIVLIAIGTISKADPAVKKKGAIIALSSIILWLVYSNAISQLGWLDVIGLPPRIPLLIIIPAILGIVLFITRKTGRAIFASLPMTFAIYIQSFRIIVELLIHRAYIEGIFPQAVTFEGTNWDILVGLTAPVIGFLFQKGSLGKKGVLIWNIAALCVLSVTGYSFVKALYFDGAHLLEFVRAPYLLLPSVLLPFAIGFHIVSIRQMTIIS